MPTPTVVAQRLYDAMAHADGIALFGLLTEDFVGTVSTGMPHGVGGEHHGAADMITEVWAGSRPFTRCMSSHTTTYTLTTSGWWCSPVLGPGPRRRFGRGRRLRPHHHHARCQIAALQQVTDTAR
jgi:2-(1,2-epoxy-1,2-dihydrophenyl)acetyl-CoA isomerase